MLVNPPAISDLVAEKTDMCEVYIYNKHSIYSPVEFELLIKSEDLSKPKYNNVLVAELDKETGEYLASLPLHSKS